MYVNKDITSLPVNLSVHIYSSIVVVSIFVLEDCIQCHSEQLYM